MVSQPIQTQLTFDSNNPVPEEMSNPKCNLRHEGNISPGTSTTKPVVESQAPRLPTSEMTSEEERRRRKGVVWGALAGREGRVTNELNATTAQQSGLQTQRPRPCP
ncbi:hypothetical protein J6590_086194 [Homalodisca vitripennis]|nr:hypothetical protein J6590_086194 [Homalodisca vitripennis]